MSGGMGRPERDEYAPSYAGYVALVPDGDLLALLAEQPATLDRLLHGLTEDQATGSFAPGEWSIKEVIGHLGDGERTFGYRAFCFSRGERSALPGFEQDDYVREANSNARTLADLLEELTLLRRANLLAYRHLAPEVGLRRGVASGVEVSVRALLAIMAGHFVSHLDDLREQYLPALKA